MSAEGFWPRFRKDRAAVLSLIVLVVLIAIAVLGPIAVHTDPTQQQLALRLGPPSLENPFGLDNLGRDILARIVNGGRVTLLSGLAATSLVTAAGVFFGFLAGYYGGWLDQLVMRVVDLMLAFPFFITAIVVVAVLGASLENAILAVTLAETPMFARVVRGSVLQATHMLYVEGARAIGATDRRIVVRHILPNILMPVIVLATADAAGIILALSGLSFLGLGVQPPTPEWGLMMSDAKGYLGSAPQMMFIPGIFLALLILSINLLGDGLRDAADPRMKRR